MLSPYLLTTVDKVKKYLNLPSDVSNSDDSSILSFIRQKSNVIENYLNRKVRLQTFTEFYDGDGSNTLQVDNYPISSVTSLNVDSQRDFDSTTDVDSDNYDIDKKRGRIIAGENLLDAEYYVDRFRGGNNYHGYGAVFPRVLNSVKIVYVAGFNDFLIATDINDTVEWSNASSQSATLTAGEYSGVSLASHIQTQMNAEISASDPYTITYNNLTGKFNFSSSESVFILKFFNGSNPEKTVGNTLGFDPAITKSGQNPAEWGKWIPDTDVIVADTVTTITPSSTTGRIKIFNQGADNDLLYSFDGGTNYFNVPPFFMQDDIMAQVASIKLKCGSGLTTTYFVAYTIEDGGNQDHDSDFSVIGIPEDIEEACIKLVVLAYGQSGKGDLPDLGLNSINHAPGGTQTFNKEEQNQILKSISYYRRRIL